MLEISPFQKSAGAFLCAAIIAIAIATLIEGEFPDHVSALSLAATATMGLFVTAFSGVVMFRLIQSAGPSFLSLTSYLIPPLCADAGNHSAGRTDFNPGIDCAQLNRIGNCGERMAPCPAGVTPNPGSGA